jgi:Tfp pilus assembly protein PilO
MSNPRSQLRGASVAKVYVCGAAVCAALTSAAYLFGVRPAVARYDDYVARQLELKTARQKAAGLLGIRNSTQNQLNAVNESLKNLTLRLEPASTVNQRLGRLTDLATKDCQLVIDEMRPMAAADGADYQTVPLLIAGSGTYPNCAKFLHKLRCNFPDTAVKSFETTNNSASPDNPTATFQVELLWHASKG